MDDPAFADELERAAALDAADELGGLRAAFHVPAHDGKALVYLAGHSLGLMPRAARDAVTAELDAWAELGAQAHFDPRSNWFAYHERFSAPLARLVGAQPREVVAMGSLTTNLHLLLVSFFRPGPERRRIVIERGAFPSDRYAVQSQLALHGLDPEADLVELGTDDLEPLSPADLDRALTEQAGRVALVLLPGVQFLTGQVLDVADYTRVAHQHGCRIGFDLAHAIGNVPLGLGESEADFAVGYSYKYLNAGPGAVAGCFVHQRWHEAGLPRLAGWWGHKASTRFALERSFRSSRGAQGWQLSNPPILALAPLAASLELFERATPAKLRVKSMHLTAFLERALERACAERIEIVTPAAERGCQLSVRVLEAEPGRLAERLRREGIVADWRGSILRLAPAPLYNTYRDAALAAQALRAALEA
jgi:kynureninase